MVRFVFALAFVIAIASCDTSGAIVIPIDGGAHDATVKRDAMLEMDAAVACDPDNSCMNEEYCAYASRVCGELGAIGICSRRPSVCSDEIEPACGCDGITYDNSCLARAAGTDVVASGECPEESCGDESCVACAIDAVPEKKNQCVCPTCTRFPTPASVCEAKVAATAAVCGQLWNGCPEPAGCSEMPVQCSSDGVCVPVSQ